MNDHCGLTVSSGAVVLIGAQCGERLAFCGVRGLGERAVLGHRVGGQEAAAAGRARGASSFIRLGIAAP